MKSKEDKAHEEEDNENDNHSGDIVRSESPEKETHVGKDL